MSFNVHCFYLLLFTPKSLFDFPSDVLFETHFISMTNTELPAVVGTWWHSYHDSSTSTASLSTLTRSLLRGGEEADEVALRSLVRCPLSLEFAARGEIIFSSFCDLDLAIARSGLEEMQERMTLIQLSLSNWSHEVM
tara:strand:- start:188 stop:598 length:411 start_codon:yes stop_codon:yes gene_type:complete